MKKLALLLATAGMIGFAGSAMADAGGVPNENAINCDDVASAPDSKNIGGIQKYVPTSGFWDANNLAQLVLIGEVAGTVDDYMALVMGQCPVAENRQNDVHPD